jgi:hypothetical protein
LLGVAVPLSGVAAVAAAVGPTSNAQAITRTMRTEDLPLSDTGCTPR